MKSIPFPNNEKAKYKMIDLFAGIGGTRLGFHLTGQVKVVFSSEIDKFAKITYKTNFGEDTAGDIREINTNDIDDHEILVAGFPCQAFSQAGKKKGFNDERGALFFEIIRILEDKKPKSFLLENVKNLKTHNKGETFKIIKDNLEKLNYYVTYSILRARDFGVPQNRERIYIVGFNKGLISSYEEFKMPTPTLESTYVGNILEQNVDSKYTISDLLWEGHQRRKAKHIAKGRGFGFSLFNKNSRYTNTISARYYKDGSEILIEQENKNPRKITPREAARLQGFPDNYLIPVSDNQAYKQFGNSVSVPVIYAIAKEILKVLDGTPIN
ncbi:DNA cytosine methyltransferase [Candidatus Mycoplasma haematobovis]|uniref:Cytosine-specific methyltransferase n=1 Tax=Candidatus Mycoplasma haematobovis TaxID=432608 RepID=A0A1A9QC11_9MOLU|nr:DNA cytosine methyltransferase [Candidatus Mycoplasma haematobovis]OAL10112.1 DNA cytosine methyltransferase [Candidatus Mycoplasma haematobovis]